MNDSVRKAPASSASTLIFHLVQAVCVLLVGYFSYHLPSPGVAVALLSIVAATIGFAPVTKGWEKAIWMVIIGGFVCVELRAISTDRASTQASVSATQTAQTKAFNEILQNQNQNFSETAQQLKQSMTSNQEEFEATLKKLDSNLMAQKLIIAQTRPKAYVNYKDADFSTAQPMSRIPLRPFFFNVMYENLGNDSAINIHTLGQVYVAPSSQSAARGVVQRKFEDAWNARFRTYSPGKLLAAGSHAFKSFESPGFTELEVSALTNHQGQIYFAFRVEYSDNTGTWVSDSCQKSVNGDMLELPTEFIHCDFFNDPRYRAK